MFILLIHQAHICTCLNFVESTFCSSIVEKMCPLKAFRRNYHDDFKDGIYLVDSITLTVMIDLSASAIRFVEFLAKLENWKLITFIEIGSVKALKAITGFFRNWGRVASNKNATFTQETVTKSMLLKWKTCHELIQTFKVEVAKFPCKYWFL